MVWNMRMMKKYIFPNKLKIGKDGEQGQNTTLKESSL